MEGNGARGPGLAAEVCVWGWHTADMHHRDAHLAGLGSGSVSLRCKGEISPERQPLCFSRALRA